MAIDFEKIFKKSGSDVEKAYTLLLKQIKSSRTTNYVMYDEDIYAFINSRLSCEDKIILFRKILFDNSFIEITDIQYQQFMDKIIDKLIASRYSIDDETLEAFNNFLRNTIWNLYWFLFPKENGCNVLLRIKELINVFEPYSSFERQIDDLKPLYNTIIKKILINIQDDIIENNKEQNIELLQYNFSRINTIDYNKRTLLFLIRDISLPPTVIAKIICKLLEVGVNPNELDEECNTFITYLINSTEYTDEEISEILLMIIPELSKYNYEFNYHPTIFKELLKTNKINDKLYRSLRDNGYDSSSEFFKEEERDIKDLEIKKYVYYRIIINKLLNFLECNSYEIDTNFKDQLFNLEDDICELIEYILFYYKYDAYRIAHNWQQAMVNHRFESVNVIDGPFTAAEAINGLKMVFNDINNAVENKFEKVKSKCLNYENN